MNRHLSSYLRPPRLNLVSFNPTSHSFRVTVHRPSLLSYYFPRAIKMISHFNLYQGYVILINSSKRLRIWYRILHCVSLYKRTRFVHHVNINCIDERGRLVKVNIPGVHSPQIVVPAFGVSYAHRCSTSSISKTFHICTSYQHQGNYSISIIRVSFPSGRGSVLLWKRKFYSTSQIKLDLIFGFCFFFPLAFGAQRIFHMRIQSAS